MVIYHIAVIAVTSRVAVYWGKLKLSILLRDSVRSDSQSLEQ